MLSHPGTHSVHPESSRGTIPPTVGALLSALLFTACVTVQGAEGGGESGWIEVRSEHFRVRAQLDPPAALEAAQSLEGLRAGVLAYWGPAVSPKDHLEVLVYRDPASLADFVAPTAGGFLHQSASGPAIVTSVAGLHEPGFRRVIAHQLAHHLGAHLMPRQPRWLAEGLAEYLETFDLEPDGTKVTYGKPPGTLGPADLSGEPITLAQLWGWTTEDTLGPQRAAWAWWVVAYLANTHAERFELWQRGLARGEEPRASWERAFAGLPDAALEAEVRAALAMRQLKFQKADLAPAAGKPELVAVDPADLHATRAELLLQSSPLDFEYRRTAATAELEAALARDPNHADALVLKARLISDPAAARAFVQRMVEVLPQNAKAWGLLASVIGRDGEDPRGTLQFALALAPDHPGLLNTLAWYSTLYEDKAAGMKLAERAAVLRPWSAAMADTSAAALGAAGRCPEAAAKERQALDLLVHGSETQRATYVERLRTYETQCSRSRPTALRR